MDPAGWSDAIPKSAIFILFFSSSNKFSGFKSRWLDSGQKWQGKEKTRSFRLFHLFFVSFFQLQMLTKSNVNDKSPMLRLFDGKICALLSALIDLFSPNNRKARHPTPAPIPNTDTFYSHRHRRGRERADDQLISLLLFPVPPTFIVSMSDIVQKGQM